MAAQVSILDLKKSFLNSQIRILNATLEPSPDWSLDAPAEHGELNDRLVKIILQKLNTILHRHNLAAYSSQAVRNVAEQVYEMYWESGKPDLTSLRNDIKVPDKGVNLADDEIIRSLPEEWTELDDEEESDLENDTDLNRYMKLQRRLVTLSQERSAQIERHAQYKLLHQLVAPFDNARENVQPNLATKDGELGKELDKMKVLIAMVREKLGGLQSTTGDARPIDAATTGPRNI